MSCLTNIEIQRAADDQGSAATASHLAACADCRTRVAGRREEMRSLARALEQASPGPSPAMESRVRAAIAGAAEDAVRPRGATALRAPSPAPRWRPAMLAFAAAAGVLLVVYLVLPRFGAPTTLSAAEILGRSLQTLSAERGVERLEYELNVGGSKYATHRIEQLVDYDHPNRFRLAVYGDDGAIEKAISQNPFTGRRTHLVRIDGRNYVFNFTAEESALIPIPELARAQLEAVITTLQATADQKLTVVDGGREYVIQMPPVTPRAGSGMLDVYQARAVIDGSDYRVREFQASGVLLKQPYTISFRLIRRTPLDPARITDRDFAIDAQPGDVVLTGEASPDMFGDVVATALHELARAEAR